MAGFRSRPLSRRVRDPIHAARAKYRGDRAQRPKGISMTDFARPQTAALARMFDSKLGLSDGEIKELFQALLGESFDPIWQVIKGEHASILWLLFQDIYEHFEKPIPEEDVTPEGGV